MMELVLKAIIILLFGILISRILFDIIRKILDDVVGVDEFLEKKKLKDAVFNINISEVIAYIVSFYILILSFVKALELFNVFPQARLAIIYYPYVSYIFGIFLMSSFLSEIVKRFVAKSKLPFSEEESLVAKVLSFFVFFYIGLDAIGIKIEILAFLIKAIIISVLGAISLAFGIGFGFYLKDEIKRWKK